MTLNTGEPDAEPFHLLLFYAFLGGFARNLLDGVGKHEPIEKYRHESLARSAEFELSAPGQSELTIAEALGSYIDERVYLLADPASRDWATAVIRDPVVTGHLRGVGKTLAALPGAAWLRADVGPSGQAVVDWTNSANPPALTTREALAELAAEFSHATPAVEGQAGASGPAQAGGAWWSAPAGVGLPYTTRKLRSFSAVELICRDDGFGETRASVWDVTVDAGARVAEIHDLADWSRLVAAYPLDVTEFRQAEWSPRFGWAGPWLLPDWGRLARDWDGVHVSAEGYLRSGGRMARVRDGGTVLEGWDPDATHWLGDVITLAGRTAETWTCDPGGQAGWHRAG
jgi:hypothetical protein